MSCEGGEGGNTEKVSQNPNYWEFVENRVVEVSPPTTISEGYIKSYKLYKVRTKKVDSPDFDTIVERRYSDFEYLHEQLI